MKQLERLLFLQGNRCFFCQHAIPQGEASIEHLVATANGGAKDDENCIVCCKSANAALGSLSVKAKLQAILNHRGEFVCPVGMPASEPPGQAQPNAEHLALVIADLQRRGPAKPRRVSTLLNTINSVFQMQLSDQELNTLLSGLQAAGHVVVQDTKVTYALPPPGT